MLDLNRYIQRFKHWRQSKTIYSIHSPYIFEYLQFVFDKNRVYYPFIALSKRQSRNINPNVSSLPKAGNTSIQKISRNTKEVVFRHLVKTQAKRLLIIGQSSQSILNYAQYSGIEKAVSLNNYNVENKRTHSPKYGGLNSLNSYDSFANLEDTYKNTSFDCIIWCASTWKPELDMKKLQQFTSKAESFVLLHPYTIQAKYRTKIEQVFPLSISTYSLQLMLRSYKGEPRKVKFTTQNWSKPWALIHAL